MSKIIALSEASSIALHSMILIAQSEENLNVIRISELTGSSKHHVAKVLQRLVKLNYLSSTRGPHGGFVLRKKPQNITLLEVYEAIEGKIEVTTCPVDNAKCPFIGCYLENITSKMTMDFQYFLQSKTLDMYLGGGFVTG